VYHVEVANFSGTYTLCQVLIFLHHAKFLRDLERTCRDLLDKLFSFRNNKLTHSQNCSCYDIAGPFKFVIYAFLS
jgi:hypothetical protein